MNARKYFEQHAEELIARYAGKNVTLFFRGFVPENVRWLAHREDAILPAGKILNADGISTFPLGSGAEIKESCFSAVTPVNGKNQCV